MSEQSQLIILLEDASATLDIFKFFVNRNNVFLDEMIEIVKANEFR